MTFFNLNYQNMNSFHLSAFLLLFAIGLTSCGSETNYVEEEKVELTKGLITELKEVEENSFKIIDERAVDNKEDSRIIAHYLDGTIDTFRIDEVQMVDQNDPNHYRRSGMSSILMGGLMGYYLGRSLSSPTRASAYVDPKTHQRVNSTTGNTLNSTARRTTVRRPTRSSSGYGGSRSTRSSGG